MPPVPRPVRPRSRAARPTLTELDARIVPTFYGNQLFPSDNPWNQVITNAPVSADSAAIISHLVSRGDHAVHPDFGNPITDGAMYGIPVNVADSTTPKVQIVIPPDGYGNESDHVLVPIPANAVIEGDAPNGPASPVGRGDSHLLVYDKSANVLYETYLTARPTESTFPSYDQDTPGPDHTLGTWGAYSLSVWDLNKNSFRTVGFTSADAAGLPILPGLVRPDEVLPASAGGQGAIKHAIRMTVSQTRTDFIFPASHQAGDSSATNLPRMGDRFRLKASFVIPSNWSPEVKAIAQAMKDYGMIVADNGSDMYFQGTPSSLWDMDSVLQLQSSIHASDFDVVDLTPVVTGLNAASGNPAGGYTVSVLGKNFTGAAGNIRVTFGTTAAAAYTVVSDARIDVTVPAHTAGTVDVRVQSGTNKVDADGQTVFFGYGTSAIVPADQFTFSSTVPPPPPGIALTGNAVPEFRPGGTTVGTLTATESGTGHTFTLTLVSGTGSTDNARFAVSGNKLLTNAVFDFPVKSSYSVRVRATDEVGNFFEQAFPIAVTDDPAVALGNRVLYVTGTTGDDSFAFAAGSSVDLLALNGVNLAVPAANVDSVVFTGNGGGDAADLSATGSGNTAALSPKSATLAGKGYAVYVSNAARITVRGRTGDVAYLSGSDGNDTLTATPTYATLAGSGYSNSAIGFAAVVAYAGKGTDVAYFTDSSGNDVFVGTPTYSMLSGKGFANYAVGFDAVSATASGGNDAAYLTDSAGIDTLGAGGTRAVLTGPGYSITVDKFDGVVAYGTAGGKNKKSVGTLSFFLETPGDWTG